MIDYHVHTTFSDGAVDYRQVIDLAIVQNITHLAITDHFDPKDAHLSNKDKTLADLKAHFCAIRAYAKDKPITVYCGIETCADNSGTLPLPDGTKEICDVIIASPHYLDDVIPCEKGVYNNDAFWASYKEKLLGIARSGADVLGHPEGYLPIREMQGDDTTYESRQEICRNIAERYFDADFIDQLGDALVQGHTACELHGATSTPREWVVQALHRKGVVFSVGSDAHAMNILGKNGRALELIDKYHLNVIQLNQKNSTQLCN